MHVFFCEFKASEFMNITKKFISSFKEYGVNSYLQIRETKKSKICKLCYRKFSHKRCFQKGCNRCENKVSILSPKAIQTVMEQQGLISTYYGCQTHKRSLRKRDWTQKVKEEEKYHKDSKNVK